MNTDDMLDACSACIGHGEILWYYAIYFVDRQKLLWNRLFLSSDVG